MLYIQKKEQCSDTKRKNIVSQIYLRERERRTFLKKKKGKDELYMALADSPGLIITHATVSYCLQRDILTQ